MLAESLSLVAFSKKTKRKKKKKDFKDDCFAWGEMDKLNKPGKSFFFLLFNERQEVVVFLTIITIFCNAMASRTMNYTITLL